MNSIDPVGLANTVLGGALLGGLIALSAVGLSLVLGVMKLVNLMHGQIVVLGAYAAFYLAAFWGISPLLALPIVFVLGFAFTAPVQHFILAPVAKHGEEAGLLTTFALAIILENLFIRFFSGDSRSLDTAFSRETLAIGPINLPTIYLIGFAISLTVCLAVWMLVTRTSFGRSLRASSEDPISAAIVGIHVSRVRWGTFALNGGLASMGGVLIALCFSFTPSSGSEYLLTAFAIIVLGGLGNIMGTFVGGIALGVIQSLGAYFFGDGYRTFVGLVMLIILLAIAPNGILKRRRSL
ncbi:branched-chain amino acid ABC transporter permease [Salinibacterium sp. NSLL150]|uniref:branched-chain amino acid ABC transporter permease n=1 Tax=unclassified Salinibacterium TaxID=2632331 RepID=UPI0018CF6703|nr:MULTISPECIES: branched-chain amino acid ABC transporter permease [unclassified Salinibacterium]MBH0025112.1 branched-chain amino acid ABC transporter permease [Salinibacterium sp. SWN248]MBH0100009.1 branched-chain amino acid ABC transporter permease [Salinibacterium sp. NSLL35]MBH0102763.1 branched-chain amino acid ABC transporter permease [Salinibacterium sp. NSLL150]MBH0105523.1 branched-chain amino acid ABC transporter permease [Salinibacterium sp. NSLL16]MBH0108283.1 branched-chain ami